jgi:hypothetical protein
MRNRGLSRIVEARLGYQKLIEIRIVYGDTAEMTATMFIYFLKDLMDSRFSYVFFIVSF